MPHALVNVDILELDPDTRDAYIACARYTLEPWSRDVLTYWHQSLAIWLGWLAFDLLRRDTGCDAYLLCRPRPEFCNPDLHD